MRLSFIIFEGYVFIDFKGFIRLYLVLSFFSGYSSIGILEDVWDLYCGWVFFKFFLFMKFFYLRKYCVIFGYIGI